ncbi:MAG: SGNH/GDSL hydrolase family protein [Provencibacterium sp.]|jgi:acyl-CoA thioesterase-1|nr:SGNH/GDSL hydrolase family protein [Provencibacterium sp.]
MRSFFKAGSVVLFQGDSVTDCGRDRTQREGLGNGYPLKIADIWRTLFGEGVTFLNRGVSGDTTEMMLARYEEDVRALQPDFISILIGINDTWRRYDSDRITPVEAFEKNYRGFLSRIRRDQPEAKIFMMEPFLLPSDPNKSVFREDLDPKLCCVRKLAEEFADYFLPLDGLLNAKAITGEGGAAAISADGVHPLSFGHSLIAEAWLKELGIL